ncbi:ABC transporter substrate-binding protein [Bradyrhizobium tunisiense]|uniref:ABC transporter substrate-binding protein n=1 Tax=Bradyrhizobium tunisiense TaxID=3278709 RepID=UPI0035D71FA4
MVEIEGEFMTARHRNATRNSTVVAAMALLAAIVFSSAALAADDVRVRFSWKLKGEYGHLYLAQDRGLYTAKNLAVRMGEGAGSQAALGALVQGQEDIVIMPGIFAASAIQKGMPIKIIALYHPKTPVVMISHPDKPILKPQDLEGKVVAHAVGETGTSYLGTFCAVNKIDCTKIKKVQMDAQSRVPQFLQNQVDAVSIYRTSDLPVLEQRTGIKFPILDLAQYGLVVPGLAAVTSDAAIAKKPDVLKRYLAAVSEGIEATRSDPRAAADAIAKVWQVGPSVDVIEAQVRATIDAMVLEEGKPIGWVDVKLIEQAIELLKTEQAIDHPKPAASFFTNELLAN